MGAVRGTWRWGSFAGGPEGDERKAMEMGISMGAQATWSGLLYRGLWEMVERGSGGAASLSGSSVKGTWREGSLAEDPGG